MSTLDELEHKSIFVIREAVKQAKKPAIMWSMGKDSTALLWLVRKAFFGKVPFPAIHIDTGYKFPQMYKYRDKYSKEWKLDLKIAQNKEARASGMGPDNTDHVNCCSTLKTKALKDFIEKEGFDMLLVAIRRDEHGVRAKERYFSPRDEKFKWDYKNQPPEMWDVYKKKEDDHHFRVHPILHWTELDVWKFIQKENIPINPMYFAKEGKRYRSLGCMPCTKPIDSDADTIDKVVEELKTTDVSERSGRAQDKETISAMQKLRALGYM
jgi:sulfate adenylyltransferase subunit 2